MSTSGKFRVSLRVFHPTLSADAITSEISFRTRFAHSVGAPRLTKSGNILGEVYSETDVSFAVSEKVLDTDEVLITEFIQQTLRDLSLEAIDRFIASGGSCFFSVGTYSEGNLMCDFDASLLSKLSVHGLGLRLDFYGGPELLPTRMANA